MSTEQHELTQDQRIADLEQRLGAQEAVNVELVERIETIEKALTSTNDALLNIQRTIVEMTASHIDRIFSDQIMVDTLAQRFFIAGANAIVYKARQSRERTPQLVVIEAHIPGAIRATLLENGGVLIEEQLKETGEWVSGEQLSENMRSEAIIEAFGNLLASYGATVGKHYFITEDVYLEQFRKQASDAARNVSAKVEGAAAPVVEEETEGAPVVATEG